MCYSLWYNAPTMLPGGDLDEVELKFGFDKNYEISDTIKDPEPLIFFSRSLPECCGKVNAFQLT